jgi:acyl carrier protein
MGEVETAIRSYIADNILFNVKGYPYADDASFLDEGVIDSMNLLQLVSFVEKRFHLKVADEDIVPEHFDSIARLASYIRARLASGTASDGGAP